MKHVDHTVSVGDTITALFSQYSLKLPRKIDYNQSVSVLGNFDKSRLRSRDYGNQLWLSEMTKQYGYGAIITCFNSKHENCGPFSQ